MCNDLFRESECTEYCDTRRRIVARDSKNKQEYRLNNSTEQEICKIRVDGCLIIDKEGKKCDYLILSCQDKLAFFVELKGSDLKEAIRQIDSSLDKLLPTMPDFKCYARVVLNKNPTPDINSSIEIKLKKRLKQQNGDNSRELIKYKSKVLEESI
ncbi:hypothetical protein NIES4074_01970 [Cylindrospermum sp. NIES-4074]|nr:hypothetical protein NIES4074_01970 [Cylindrospermum sp. NIES-4074]